MTTSASTPEQYAWIRLSLEPNLSLSLARILLATFGLPHHIYTQSISTLSRYVPIELATQLRTEASEALEQHIQRTLEWAQQADHHLLFLADEHYPVDLLTLHDPPLVLYAKGNLQQLQLPALAIVGARSATVGGTENAFHFAHYLVEQGWCIISGLATGIDTAAHQGALAPKRPNNTIAVVGTGLDLVYPARNRELAHHIAAQGLLLSEFPLGAKALPHHFIQRNRLVAALSNGVLVVEAALKSGSLTTARYATEMGRDVFAIPGSIHSPLHKGCHQLIRQGAKLVEMAEHILEELPKGLQPKATPVSSSRPPKQTNTPLNPLQEQVLHAMGYDPVSANQIQKRSSLSTAQVGATLVQLELADIITQQLDGLYIRNSETS